METTETKEAPKKKPKKSELSHLSDVIQLMKDSGVSKFKYKDLIEVEFEPFLKPMKIPVTMDDEKSRADQIKNLSELLKEDADEELKDLLWST